METVDELRKKVCDLVMEKAKLIDQLQVLDAERNKLIAQLQPFDVSIREAIEQIKYLQQPKISGTFDTSIKKPNVTIIGENGKS